MLDNKLLSIVYEENVIRFEIFALTDYGETVEVSYIDDEDNESMFETTLLEVANKCKSTFLYYGNGYCINSFIDFSSVWFGQVSGNIHKQSFQGQSEYEVVFKASQWCIEIEEENIKIEKDAKLQEDYDAWIEG